MKERLLNSLLFILLGVMNCFSQQFKSSFTFSITDYYATFDNQSTFNPSNVVYYWNFGDGQYSSLKNPIHAFTNPGEYPVALYVTDSIHSDVYIDTVKIVYQSPGCKALFSYTITQDSIVQFFNMSTGVDSSTTFLWTFGSSIYSNLQDPIRIYKKGGLKRAKLVISNASCLDSFDVTFYIKPSRTCNAQYTHVLKDDTVFFTENSLNTMAVHFWTFGDNSTSTAFNPYHVYAKNGSYITSLQINDTSIGCKEVWTDTVVVTGIPCAKANFKYTVNNNTVIFTDCSSSGMAYYFWLFGDGRESTQKNPVHTYDKAGDYILRLYISDSNFTCTDSMVQVIHILPKHEKYSIKGKVLLDNNLIDQALVLLIYTDSITKSIYKIDTAFVEKRHNGEYVFEDIAKGYYMLKALIPTNSLYHGKYVSEYLTGEYLWEVVKPIYINFNFDEANFNLDFISQTNKLGILSGSCVAKEENSFGTNYIPTHGKNLLVFDVNNIPIGNSMSDINGRYNIALNDEGLYKIYMDIPGKKCSPLQFEIMQGKLYFDKCMMVEDALSTYPNIELANGIEVLTNAGLNAFPNPVHSILTLNSILGINDIYLFDLLGKKVLVSNFMGKTSIEINLENLPNGMYLMQVVDLTGAVSTKRIIKQ